jgi:CHAT domain-containing protein
MDSRIEFKPLPVPNLGYDYQKPALSYFRVWHSKTQRNPEDFVVEEVDTKIVKARTDRDAKRKVQNTYKHHVLKVEEITDTKELEAIRQKLFEKKVEEVV